MSKKKASQDLVDKYSNNLKESAFFRGITEKDEIKKENNDVSRRRQSSTSVVDVKIEPTPISVIQPLSKPKSKEIDIVNFSKVITGLLSSRVSTHGTPVRVTNKEKEMIREFLFNDLYQKVHTNPKQVGESKIYRLALIYMITNHKDEFMYAIQQALQKTNNEYDF